MLVRALSDAETGWWEDWPVKARAATQSSLLLRRPFLRREAVLSSRIEGTQATLGELLAAGAGRQSSAARGPARSWQLRDGARIRCPATEETAALLAPDPGTARQVDDRRPRQAGHAGEFRRSQNWIGPAGAPWRMRPTSPAR